MHKKLFLISGATIIVTIFSMIAYFSMSIFGNSQSVIASNKLTIVTGSSEKIYDGAALFNSLWYIESGQLIEGDTISVVMPSSQTNPGSIVNEIGITILDKDSHVVTESYEITYDLGILTVDQRELLIQTDSEEKMYDGSALSNPIWDIFSGQLLNTHHIEFVMNSNITIPGSIPNEIGITILDEQNNVVTGYYNIGYIIGNLIISPITIVLESESASKVYDGEPLICPDWELTGSILDQHEIIVITDTRLTDIGTIDNLIYAYIIDDQGNIVNGFYNIIYHTGQLTVLSSGYSTGAISRSSFPLSNEEVLKIYSSISGLFYLRDTSWGSYDILAGWSVGVQQNTSISTNPLSYASFALADSGKSLIQIQIEYLRDQMPFLLPYYTLNPIDSVNDIHAFGEGTGTVSLSSIYYQFNSLDSISLQDSQLVMEELIYRDYVYEHYLDLPESTREGLLLLAQQNGLISNSPTIITDIQTYISNAAVYNLQFQTIPEDADIALYFLTVSKEGICQHFATAAALMYRALGIPARYVTGYVGNASANQWKTVTDEQAHAWVEIYINGFGWVPIEVTSGTNKINITAAPASVIEVYETGKVITATSVIFSGFSSYALQGYTYQATFSGILSEPGKMTSSILSLVIYDENGIDVTHMFDIEYYNGKLQLFITSFVLYTESATKEYDGISLTNDQWSVVGDLMEGHYIDHVVFTGKQTDVGISKNSAVVFVFDQDGNDVTSIYNIQTVFGNLSVTPRTIFIQSCSDSKQYDGQPLTCHEYEIVSGTLADSDVIEITITGTQKTIGQSLNTVESIIITHLGIDVSKNYTIEIIEGELTVSP